MCSLLSVSAYAASTNITKDDALTIAQQQFEGQDVDFYILQDNSALKWTVFVDAEPMKGWEHECYVLTIPKTTTGNISSVIPTKETRRMPPEGNYVPLKIQNRYGANATSKPKVAKSTYSNTVSDAAQRTHALIISGGYNKLSNYERYWNDCSFIYQTLVNKYGVPRNQIYPLMSDGNDPGADMRCTDGTYKSQPLDLDGDGTDDIELAATYGNIQSTLYSLSNKLKEDDQLFIFVIDHGGSDDYNTASYICLWNQTIIRDSELAEMLTPFCEKYCNVNVVLGQCYSGGFNDNLTKIGCVVASACSGSESSWACSDIPYDEFVYQWTSAVNGANHRGVKVNADSDNNGRVTMEEAFAYAKDHDRRTIEHPKYVSTPISVGEDLAFNHLAPAIDLYIKDNPEDTGKEPNLTTDKFWLSPSIWIRNKADGVYQHENPIYSEDHLAATVYVRIYNRGKKEYGGGSQYIHVYWAKASTGFGTQTWMGNEIHTNGEVTGGPLTPYCIPKIKPGGYVDCPIIWALPTNLLGTVEDNGTEKHHFCLLGKILNTHIEPWYTGTFSYNCKLFNDDAQKNVSIISTKELSEGTAVYVRNILDDTRKYTLELIPRTTADAQIYSAAKVEMEMSPTIFNAWEEGGSNGINIYRAPAARPRVVEFLSKDSRLEAISLKGKVFDKITMKFNFRTVPVSDKTYTLDLIQKDENGEIIGGETFIVESPIIQSGPIELHSTFEDDDMIKISADIDEGETIRWENSDGTTIGYKDSVVIKRPIKAETFTAYVMSEDGGMSRGSIKIGKVSMISSVAFDTSHDSLSINFRSPASADACIMVSSASTNEVCINTDISAGMESCTTDVSRIPDGVYVVSYISAGTIIDSVKVVK